MSTLPPSGKTAQNTTRYPFSTPWSVILGGSAHVIAASSDVTEMARTFWGGWLGTENKHRQKSELWTELRGQQEKGWWDLEMIRICEFSLAKRENWIQEVYRCQGQLLIGLIMRCMRAGQWDYVFESLSWRWSHQQLYEIKHQQIFHIYCSCITNLMSSVWLNLKQINQPTK